MLLSSLRDRFGSRRLLIFGVFALLVVVGGGVSIWWAVRHAGGRSVQSTNPLIITPTLALESLNAKTLYYNAPARRWLLAKRADLLAADDRKEKSERGQSFALAAQNPKLFRQLDREQRFDALFLVGDPSQYQPLMDHLLETTDWKLSYLDHASMVFRREVTEPWTPERLRLVEAKLGAVSASDRALFLAEAAGKLLAVRKIPAAKAIIDEAGKIDPKTPQVWSSLASYHLALGEWSKAVAMADRALELDRDCLEALGAKAQAQYSSKQFSEALATSRRLVVKLPDDPQILFYHAKIAHEAGQYGEEIEVLRKLIDLAVEDQRPTSGYRLYLGQAYARDGEAIMAKRELNLALADPELPKELREFANECMALIEKKTKGK